MKSTSAVPQPPESRDREFSGDGSAQTTPQVSPTPSSQNGTPATRFADLTERVRSRRPHKVPGADLKQQYRLTIEIGFVLALAIVVALTQLNFEFEGETSMVTMEQQEVVQMQEIKQTEQVERTPPPPRPPAPVEVPNDEIIEDEAINLDASLDLNESLDVSSPPPPPPKQEEEEEDLDEEEIFIAVEERPELIGGLKALQEEIQYPEMARRAGLEGRVVVQFVVNTDGRITDPIVLSSPHKLLSEEAVRVIRTARFKPGKQRDKPVRVQMALPITFRLKDK